MYDKNLLSIVQQYGCPSMMASGTIRVFFLPQVVGVFFSFFSKVPVLFRSESAVCTTLLLLLLDYDDPLFMSCMLYKVVVLYFLPTPSSSSTLLLFRKN